VGLQDRLSAFGVASVSPPHLSSDLESIIQERIAALKSGAESKEIERPSWTKSIESATRVKCYKAKWMAITFRSDLPNLRI